MCAPTRAIGLRRPHAAGFTFAGTTQFPGLLCRINGEPASDPCHGAPPPDAYWGYWHAPRGGSWTYSSSGAGSRVPPAGSVEGWSFGDRDEPGMAPPAPATTSTTTRPPTTPTTQGSLGGPATATPTTADAQGGGAGATSTTAPDGSTSTTSEPGSSVPRAEDDGVDGENALRGESASATEPVGDDGGSPVGVVVAALVALALGGAAAITAKRRRSHEAGDSGAPPPGAPSGRVVALGPRPRHRRQPHHQPVAARAHRRRARLRRGRPAHRRALGAGLQGVLVPGPGRDRDPGPVPHAARRAVRRPHPVHAARAPPPRRGRGHPHRRPRVARGAARGALRRAPPRRAAPVRRGRQRARQPEAAPQGHARGPARDRGGGDGCAQRRPAAHRERPASASGAGGCGASPAAGSTSSGRSPSRS